jgi:hypothetical protein
VARAKEKKKEEEAIAKQAALLAKQERDVNNAAEKEKAKQMAAAAEEKASKATASVAIKTAEKKPETVKANQTKEYNEVAAPAPPKERATKGTVTSDRGLVKPAAQVKERATIVQQTVSFTSDSLFITLYDNGEVDGDTVSVLLNGNIILEKQGLSTTAIKKTIYIPAHLDRMELVMYAESLGTIAPNTGLLVIRDGKQLYEVRFSGDLQKNASIVLNRKKE